MLSRFTGQTTRGDTAMTFDDWRKTVDLNRFGTSDPVATYARAAWLAGVLAERERCAKLVAACDPFRDGFHTLIESIRNPKG